MLDQVYSEGNLRPRFHLARETIWYGTGTLFAAVSLRGATQPGTATLYDHPSSSGTGDHTNGCCVHSSAFPSDSSALDEELSRASTGRSGRLSMRRQGDRPQPSANRHPPD